MQAKQLPNVITAVKGDNKQIHMRCGTCDTSTEHTVVFKSFDAKAQIVWMSKECTECVRRSRFKENNPSQTISGTMPAFDFHQLWHKVL